MRYFYTITEVPKETGGYNIPAYTEGTLRVEHGNEVLFEAEEILLVEFAIALYKWLVHVGDGTIRDFYYASMNFEDEPIVALRYDVPSDSYAFESAWNRTPPPRVPAKKAICAAEHFLSALQDDLERTLSVRLMTILVAAAADELPGR